MAKRLAPGHRGHILLGNIPEYFAEGLEFQRRTARTYGDVAAIRLSWSQAYLVTEPELVRHVLVRDTDAYRKAAFYRVLLRRFLGDGLLTTDGAFWRRQRDLSQPAMHSSRIAAYAGIMVSHAERMLRDWQPGQVINIQQEMRRLTLGIIAKTLFDYELEGDSDPFGQALTMLIRMNSEAAVSPFFTMPLWVPTPRNVRQRRAIETLDRTVYGIIAERRKTGADRGDILSMLARARDADGQGMSDKELRDEAITLVASGHETITNALTWTWYLLSQHPNVEAKLHAEIDRAFGGRLPVVEDYRQLDYAERVVKESMRMYAPIPTFARQALRPTTLGDFDVPKGTLIFIGVDVMHHDARWFDDPERFDPDRFSKDNEKLIPKYAYLPFGGGSHICIGNGYAMLEASLLLAVIAQRYRLRLVPGQRVEARPMLSLSPKAPILMQLEPREPTPAHTELASD